MTTLTTNLFAPRTPTPSRTAGLSRVLATLAAVRAVAAERSALARLDARMLEDAGIAAADAAREAARAPWDLPAARRF